MFEVVEVAALQVFGELAYEVAFGLVGKHQTRHRGHAELDCSSPTPQTVEQLVAPVALLDNAQGLKHALFGYRCGQTADVTDVFAQRIVFDGYLMRVEIDE